MKVYVGSGLLIKEPTGDVREYCKNNLIIDNAEYYKRASSRRNWSNIPKEFKLYEVHGEDLLLPFGCLNDIWALHPIKEDFVPQIRPVERLPYTSSIKPYKYQETAINAVLRRKNGVLVMPCGSGKTQCGLEIISRVGGRALWLTHTRDLLHQSWDRAMSVFDSDEVGFGSITSGEVNVGTHITFATIQTMSRVNLEEFKDMFDIVIVDEAQHCAGTPTKVTQFYKVVSRLSARYKIGLTATPKRADGLQRAMFALLGPKIHEVPVEEVDTCPIKVMALETSYAPNPLDITMPDGSIDYNKLIQDLTHDDGRFDEVLNTVVNLPKNAPTLVLGNRVEYLERLSDYYDVYRDGIEPSICLSSSSSKSLRKNALTALNNGELDCIFATYLLAKEGLDIPNLRYVVFATPEQDETTVIQSAGRVGRTAEGKDCGIVIDFVDSEFDMYKRWYKKRVGYYKKIGAEVVE